MLFLFNYIKPLLTLNFIVKPLYSNTTIKPLLTLNFIVKIQKKISSIPTIPYLTFSLYFIVSSDITFLYYSNIKDIQTSKFHKTESSKAFT